MSNIAAFIDFKSGNPSSRSVQIINLVNSLAKSFTEVEQICFYTFDLADSSTINSSVPASLFQIKGISLKRILYLLPIGISMPMGNTAHYLNLVILLFYLKTLLLTPPRT